MKILIFLLLTLGTPAFEPSLPRSFVYVPMQSGTIRQSDILKWKVRLRKQGCRQVEVIQLWQQYANVYCIAVEADQIE